MKYPNRYELKYDSVEDRWVVFDHKHDCVAVDFVKTEYTTEQTLTAIVTGMNESADL